MHGRLSSAIARFLTSKVLAYVHFSVCLANLVTLRDWRCRHLRVILGSVVRPGIVLGGGARAYLEVDANPSNLDCAGSEWAGDIERDRPADW